MQIGSSTCDLQKILTYGFKKKEKAVRDASLVMAQQKQKRKEEVEVTSTIKYKTDFHDVGITGHLDLGQSNDGWKRGKGRLKKLAREQGPRGENSIMTQEGAMGTKSTGEIEILEAEENRVTKKVSGAEEVPTKNGNSIIGSAMVARQHHQEP